MNRSERLIKDVLLFTISTFGPKLLSFFLVPLYTSCLKAEEFGTFDLLTSITGLILPILMLDISDAILIYTVEYKNTEKENQPFKYGNKILIITTCILLVICGLSSFILNENYINNFIFVVLNYCTTAFYYNLLAYVRGKDRPNIIVTSSIINCIVTLLCNIILILFLKKGLQGMFIACVSGMLASDIYISCKINIIKILKTSKQPSAIDKKRMIKYSFPLIFTGLAWWVNGSSDRIFLSILGGVGLNGIYAVANKIPTILSAFHSVAYQAMQLNVFREMHADDKGDYLKNLYNIYSFIMFSICSLLIIVNKILASFLFKGDFYIAWKYSPALLISVAFLSISGYLTTIYSAEKETKLIAKATIIGAIFNTVFNIILIPRYEIFGAVIATVTSYFLIWFLMAINSEKIVKIKLPVIKCVVIGCILLSQWMVQLFLNNNYIIQFCLLIILLLLNRNTVMLLYKLIINEITKIKSRKTVQ